MDSLVEKDFKTFLVTSCKGGVGRSTVAANLAAAIAKRDKTVLLVDCDFSNRALDLMLGCDESMIYDICDLAARRADVSRAVIHSESEPRLHFIPAPQLANDIPEPEQIGEALSAAARELRCAYVIIDTSSSLEQMIPLLAPAADGAIVVTSHHPTAVRAAEKTGYLLEDIGVGEQYLVINKFDAEGVLDGAIPGVNELIDRTHVRLIGVVPESSDLDEAQMKGILVANMRRDRDHAREAFDEIAGRLCGENIPLMSWIPEKKRRKLLKI